MQNVQNADIQRVMNLVDLYRTKVGKESQIAKDAKADQSFWIHESIDVITEDDLAFGGIYAEGPHTEVWIKHLMVNEQLLGHFYAEVANENADKNVLSELLPDVYDRTIFTEEEEAFLKLHFRDLVNYIIQTPCDDLDYVNRHDGKDIFLIPEEIIDLIYDQATIPVGSIIYDPFSGFGQLACLYQNCKSYCGPERTASESEDNDKHNGWLWAWLKVSLYANAINADIIEGLPSYYDAVVSFIPMLSEEELGVKRSDYWVAKILEAYKKLPLGGKLILLCPSSLLWKKQQSDFREQLVSENSIVKIIQLPSVMSPNLYCHQWCLLIAEKGHQEDTTIMVDVRYAFKETTDALSLQDLINMGEDICGIRFISTETGKIVKQSGPFPAVLDRKAIMEMMDNHGIQPETGLHKLVHVKKSNLDINNLIPQIYVIEKPSPDQKPKQLDSICRLVTDKVRSLDVDLPLDTPWIRKNDLSCLYKGELNVDNLDIANCPNNPPHTPDYEFDKDGKFIEDNFHYILGNGSSKGMRVAQYRDCTFLDGSNDAVILNIVEGNVKIALLKALDKPVVVEGGFVAHNKLLVFYPNTGIDALKLLTLLKMPVVYRQILAYEDYGLQEHMKDILVPSDELIINDEKKRVLDEERVYRAQVDELATKKKEYINEVRMRKHDMGQYIFELMNIEDLMRYYLDNKDNEKDFYQQIGKLLNNFRDSLRELSTMLDDLSKEEQFGEPEPIDIQDFLIKLEQRHQAEGYKVNAFLDLRALWDYREKMAKSMGVSIPLEDTDKIVPMMYISRNDLQRMANNILDNARKHGFTDHNRKDYEVQVNVSIDAEKGMFQIDFRNNGNPLPDGMNKMRYGIKGEKAGQTGGTGIGGNYVKSFVEHYGGDYDIFMENGWTVVRICLPIK